MSVKEKKVFAKMTLFYRQYEQMFPYNFLLHANSSYLYRTRMISAPENKVLERKKLP